MDNMIIASAKTSTKTQQAAHTTKSSPASSSSSSSSSKSIITEYVTTVTLSQTTTWSVADTTYIAQVVSESIYAYPPEDPSKSSMSLLWGPLIPPTGPDAHTETSPGHTTIKFEPASQATTSAGSSSRSTGLPAATQHPAGSDISDGSGSSGLNTGAKVGIAIGAVVGALLLAAIAYMFGRRRNRNEVARAVEQYEASAKAQQSPNPNSPGTELAGYYGGGDTKRLVEPEPEPVYELNGASHAELPVWVDRPELKGSAVRTENETRPDTRNRSESASSPTIPIP